MHLLTMRNRLREYITHPLCLLIVAAFFCISTGNQAITSFSVNKAFAKTMGTQTINGVVFDDYNENGRRDAREPGMNGIVVVLYNAANRVIASQSTHTVRNTSGVYNIAFPAQSEGVRVQFNNFGTTSTLPQLIGYQPSNHKGGTTLAFVNGNQRTSTVNLGIERPEEYCQNNPQLVTGCYTIGNQNTSAPVMVKFDYQWNGVAPRPTPIAKSSEIGATWGLAYRRSSDSLFATAYIKRHTGLKPNGSTGAIYLLKGVSTAKVIVQPTPFVDLNKVFGANTAGANPHDARNYNLDAAAYDMIGKVGLGGLALSEDETTLYTVNLANKELYGISLGATPAPPRVGRITHEPIPVPTDCPDTDFRPFALSSYQGNIYVGAVCSAESTVTTQQPEGDPNAMHAYVFLYTPGKGFTNTPIFQFPLNYPRHCATSTTYRSCTTTATANWFPWHPGFAETVETTYPTYPQPMLASIAFDNGDMILGMRDRYGDQLGFHNLTPDGKRSVSAITAGDILRACLKTPEDLSNGWNLENDGSCGGIKTIGFNNKKGPGDGQYYYRDYFLPFHDHVSTGSVLQIPGFPEVVSTTFDTIAVNTGGVRYYSDTTGSRVSWYQIYDHHVAGEFSKANGLGALVALCQSAPIEIGNRVWLDKNGDGIQEANESGIRGVTVHLYDIDGRTLVATTKTDAQGNYYFTIKPYKRYVIKVDNALDYTSGALKHSHLSPADRDARTHLIDSKAVLVHPSSPISVGNYPQVVINAHKPGQNDYNQDIGFKI